MFTGIITGIGEITRIESLGDHLTYGKRLHITAPGGYLDDVGLGDSIAINGACMTVTSFDVAAMSFTIDVSAESLDKTSGLTMTGRVNLEKALRASDRLGGHIVSGHVDGVGTVKRFETVGESWLLQIETPLKMAPFLAYKGSVTVNQVQDSSAACVFDINLIPHTLENTALGTLKPGVQVNLEVDVLARYVERMLSLKG